MKIGRRLTTQALRLSDIVAGQRDDVPIPWYALGMCSLPCVFVVRSFGLVALCLVGFLPCPFVCCFVFVWLFWFVCLVPVLLFGAVFACLLLLIAGYQEHVPCSQWHT